MSLATRSGLSTCISACLFLLASTAHAEPDGQKIYTQGGQAPAAVACATCHAADGMGTAGAGFPRLAGLPQGYLSKQLEDFRSGKRANAVMQPIAQALDAAEGKAVATYLSALEVPGPSVNVDPTGSVASAAEKLVKQGDWSRNIPACVACHGQGNTGVGEHFPPLVGQSGAYITAQLNAWRSGARKNDPNDLMGHVARSLSDAEVRDVSAYFASLSAEAKQ
ncbi:c-type cytochrome [Pseudomonas putida]